MEKIRVLIVDDSFFMRQVIKNMLRADPGIDVVGEAANGDEALAQIAALSPDVVTLDIEMPQMGGLETLRNIVRTAQPPSVIIVSGYAKEGADITLQCLAIGAADFVLKPSGALSLDMDKVKDTLLEKITVASRIDTTKVRDNSQHPPKPWHYQPNGGVVVIGASTGGPAALEALLPQLPPNFPCPVIIAQHLPKSFAASFTERLRQRCHVPVFLGEQGMKLSPGIYIASGGTTVTVTKKNDEPILAVTENTQDIESPSVSKLMASAAATYEGKVIGVILTGMGKDGLTGMEQIKKSGGKTIVQDASTSVVYGMGQAVVHEGLADSILPLGQIVDKINEIVGA